MIYHVSISLTINCLKLAFFFLNRKRVKEKKVQISKILNALLYTIEVKFGVHKAIDRGDPLSEVHCVTGKKINIDR